MISLPDRVGVYGGGRMGAGIAHAFLMAGISVIVVEQSDEAAASAEQRVRKSIARAIEKGAESPSKSLRVTTDPAELADIPVIIEAVPELPDVKVNVLRTLDAVAPTAWIGSNTSSLSVDMLANALAVPSRLIGLHFFNPVPVSRLVEIVVGPRTSTDLVAHAQAWVAGLSRTAIRVSDSPGFASSRLGVAMALEAMRMLESGVASAEDIDLAMTLGYHHSMGPLRTTDIVGLDVRLDIAEHLARELGPRFEPPEILRELVATGRLGRKSGQGFFVW